MKCHYTFTEVKIYEKKNLITEEQKFQSVSVVELLIGLLAGRSDFEYS